MTKKQFLLTNIKEIFMQKKLVGGKSPCKLWKENSSSAHLYKPFSTTCNCYRAEDGVDGGNERKMAENGMRWQVKWIRESPRRIHIIGEDIGERMATNLFK